MDYIKTTMCINIYICMYVYVYIEREREWDVVRARVFQCFSLFVHMFCVFCHLLHTFSVI